MHNGTYTSIERRHDFVLLFDVTDGNPNGDPDAGNLPRIDPETMHGLVTDVSLKRKVRDWIDATRGTDERFKIYVQKDGESLNTKHERAYSELGLKSTGSRQKADDIDQARAWMCNNFYDIRTFGAVMTTGINCGQVRGPIQLTFARSIDPIVPLDLAITRVAVTREQDRVVASDNGGEQTGKTTEMGRKSLVPYGLYRVHGFVIPTYAEKTGFSDEDLELFWQALGQMFDLDRSASRGQMACRGVYIFSHESKLGNAPAHQLQERVDVRAKDGVDVPRRFNDYEVTVVESGIPDGVDLTRLYVHERGRV